MMKRLLILGSVAALSFACEYHARSADDYKSATRELLQTRNDDVKACYDKVLAANGSAEGSVEVSFSVMAETGALTDIEVLPSSTAPAELGQCIVSAIDGLALDPADERKGEATFAWQFGK